MGIIGGNWKDEETNEEKYVNIVGGTIVGRSEKEIDKEIDKSLEDGYTSRSERTKLMDLKQQINNNQ